MSIAEKLDTVGKNQQKVFDAGKKSVCPAIDESGAMVVCCPIDMTVTASAEVNTITRCGKNLLDLSIEKVKKIKYFGSSGSLSAKEYWGVELILPPGTYTIHATAKVTGRNDYVYCQVNNMDKTGHIKVMNPVVGTTRTVTGTFDEWVRVYVYDAGNTATDGQTQSGAAKIFAYYDIQLEASPVATDFEPYVGETFTPGEAIPVLPGVNTIYADAGEITVTGTADPIATIEYLTNAFISFGGNV